METSQNTKTVKFIYQNIEFSGYYIEPQYRNILHLEVGSSVISFKQLVKQPDRIFIQIHFQNEIHRQFCFWYYDKISVPKNSITIL